MRLLATKSIFDMTKHQSMVPHYTVLGFLTEEWRILFLWDPMPRVPAQTEAKRQELLEFLKLSPPRHGAVATIRPESSNVLLEKD